MLQTNQNSGGSLNNSSRNLHNPSANSNNPNQNNSNSDSNLLNKLNPGDLGVTDPNPPCGYLLVEGTLLEKENQNDQNESSEKSNDQLINTGSGDNTGKTESNDQLNLNDQNNGKGEEEEEEMDSSCENGFSRLREIAESCIDSLGKTTKRIDPECFFRLQTLKKYKSVASTLSRLTDILKKIQSFERVSEKERLRHEVYNKNEERLDRLIRERTNSLNRQEKSNLWRRGGSR